MKPTTKKTIGVLVGSVAVIIGCFICNFYISFGYGGWDGFFSELRSLPNDETLASLRSGVVKDLTDAHAELGSIAGLTLYEKTYSDMCAKGEHNWKRSEPYAYTCAYRLTYYYNTNWEYKELLLDLEKTLNDLGWKVGEQSPKQPTISEALQKSTEEIYLVELPYYHRRTSDDFRLTLVINGFHGYGVPWTKSSDEPDPFGFGIGIGQEIYKNASNQSPEEIFNKIISTGQKAIMIAISTEYFSN